jgi:hypothetical protein
MKVTTRIYLDAALQNTKSVAFFTFLPVLIARLGASDFQITLSNSLPALFCSLSLAFVTRQLPVTRGVYLAAGYVRQFAFLGMALSILLPNPFPVLLLLWAINAASVMVTAAQHPAILRRVVEDSQFPTIFSRNKVIGIVIVTFGSLLIGRLLDSTDAFFPNNYVVSMLVGCLATFAGMALIAGMAPRTKAEIKPRWMRPLKEANRGMFWLALNNMGIHMVPPLFVIYHVKQLGLNNTQISYFVVLAGIISVISLPLVRRAMDRFGIMPIYSIAVISMALLVLPYGTLHTYGWLLAIQAAMGLCLAVHEVSNQSTMMKEAGKHPNEMAYFSDFQLLMQLGMTIGPFIAGVLVLAFPLWVCFIIVAVIRLLIFASARLFQSNTTESPSGTPSRRRSYPSL